MAHDVESLSSGLVVHAARLVRAVRRAVDQPAGVRVLSLLDELGPQGVSDLATADRCSQPTMSQTVAGLLEHEWVGKTPDPEDARRSVVALTAAGRRELARVRRANARAVAQRLTDHPTLTSEDLATAVAVLRAVLDDSFVKGTL